jgi:hypothetical protein
MHVLRHRNRRPWGARKVCDLTLELYTFTRLSAEQSKRVAHRALVCRTLLH